MKPHERDLLVAFHLWRPEDVTGFDPAWESGRTFFMGYDMPINRVYYLLSKWGRKGWYDYGVNVLCGWLTPEGREAAMEAL